MALFRTTAPAAEPVTLAEAKQHLRLDHDGEDGLIEGLIRAAREEVEAATGLALIDQTWRLTLDRVPVTGVVRIARHPVKEILSVTVFGADGEGILVDPATYRLDPHSRPARLWFSERPLAKRVMNGVEIDLAAGFGEAGPDVPDLLKRAMLALVGHWFEFRLPSGPTTSRLPFPPAIGG
ncbi:MAG: head-tail connector protein [Aliihoeflea sp.]